MATENNKKITPKIDYRKIADAKEFYEKHGFKEIAVPWILSYEPYRATKPTDKKDFYTVGGYLNASGEQGFLELMLSGKKLSKNLCISACFRAEPVLDELHQIYFVKLELIDITATIKNLYAMIRLSKQFFDKYMTRAKPTKVIQTDTAGPAFDIVDGVNGIELGSYGIRKYKKFKWIYGTGIALPRLDVVINKTRRKNNV